MCCDPSQTHLSLCCCGSHDQCESVPWSTTIFTRYDAAGRGRCGRRDAHKPVEERVARAAAVPGSPLANTHSSVRSHEGNSGFAANLRPELTEHIGCAADANKGG